MNEQKPTLQSLVQDKKGKCLLPCIIGAVIFAIIAIVAIVLILRSNGFDKVPMADIITQESLDAIVQHGQVILTERRNAGEDLSQGPCLDNNEKFKGWVIDIAHDPRVEADDNPDNQCSAYSRGSAKNFIELSEYGDIIQIYPPRGEDVLE